ncbi:MAG: WG repeat-containing protein [Vicingaceae bacterium]|nr:WG repeat-containing protein [Vicingaceae bacterium]
MKEKLQTLTIAGSIALIISSCGGGGNSISEVKLIPVLSGKEYQYIDREGKIIINPQFREASVFREGLGLVRTSGDESKWGFIDEAGQYKINAQYKEATIFSDGLAWVVSENGAPEAINTKGEIQFNLPETEKVKVFKEGLAAFSTINEDGEEKWGFVDKKGTIVINAQFTETSNFNNKMCAVSNNDGKWGFIDKEGKILINHQFDFADDFINGKCVVNSGGKSGVIDEEGKYIINPQFKSITIDGDMFFVNQDGKFGWCDKEGKILINPQFSHAFPFLGNKITAVQSGKSYGYIDMEGKIVINPQFDIAMPFNGKLALVTSSNKIGFIDKEGKYIINPQYDNISKDYIVYKSTGKSIYESIKTDFFNISAIISRINFESPEGLSFNSKISDVLDKFKKSQQDFSKYGREHLVISSEKITNDATLDFYILDNPWVGNYYNYTFNKELNLTSALINNCLSINILSA